MRILYILSGTEAKGGATKSFLAMADSVAAAGHEVAVVAPDENGIVPVLRNRDWEVLVVPYMFATLPYLSWSPRNLVRFLPRLGMAINVNLKARKVVNAFARKWHPDIIHDNTSVIDLGYYAARELGIPHVIHIREYGWQDFRRIIPGLRKRLSASNSYPVAITSSLASFRSKGLDAGRIKVVYNGVVSEKMAPYNPAKQPFFFYAGRITEAKGVSDMMKAYISYARNEIGAGGIPLRLRIAGACHSDNFIDRLKFSVKNAGIESYVEWLGEIDDVATHYSVAAATVIPSRSEGFGRVMPEAMSAGSLCVVRDSGGLSEQLENGRRQTGREIAYGYDSVGQLADILSEIAVQYGKGEAYEENGCFFRMISDSRSVVGSLYSYESNARGILKLYSDILESQ